MAPLLKFGHKIIHIKHALLQLINFLDSDFWILPMTFPYAPLQHPSMTFSMLYFQTSGQEPCLIYLE